MRMRRGPFAIDDSIVLTTQDAETDTVPSGSGTDTAQASFAAAFLAAAVPVYGADGPGTTVISNDGAACTTRPTTSPRVSVMMCRLRPFTFLPAS